MRDQVKLKPMRYIRERIVPRMSAAAKVFVQITESLDRSATASACEALRQLKEPLSADEQYRVARVQQLAVAAHLDRTLLREVCRIAMEANNEFLCGLAWLAIAQCEKRDRGALIEQITELLETMCAFRDESLLPLVAACFVEYLAAQADSVVFEHQYQAKRLESKAIVEAHVRMRECHLRQCAGSDYDAMAKDAKSAARFLSHPNPHRRYAALCMLERHLTSVDTTVAHGVEACFRSDPCGYVRIAAVAPYKKICKNWNRRYAMSLFAAIVKNERNSWMLREVAYNALCEMVGINIMELPFVRFAHRRLRFSADIDWQLVESVS